MKLTKTKVLTKTMTKSRGIHLICLINVNIVDDELHEKVQTLKLKLFPREIKFLRNIVKLSIHEI